MERRRIQESGEGAMKGLLKGALAVGGGVVGAEVARRTFFWGARPRYEPWERAPYHTIALGVSRGQPLARALTT